MDKKKPMVIAIASISGGGKTTIVNYLSKALSSSKALYFDDYDFVGPDDICEWVERGADCNEWDLTPIVEDLLKLHAQEENMLEYIFMDYPFAYLHRKMSLYIDVTVFIETPLDIALARRILRDFTNAEMKHVISEMEAYLLRGRFAYLHMLNTVKPNSDIVIDGTLTLENIASQICLEVMGREI